MRPCRSIRFVLAAFLLSLTCGPARVCDASFLQDDSVAETSITSKLQARQLDAALEEARQAVSRSPNSSTLNQLMGVALFKKGLNDEARTAFRRAIQLDPSVPQNYYNLALVDLSDKRDTDAVPNLQAFLRLDPENGEGHLLLGRALHNLNQTEPAIQEFKKALTLAPNLPLAHYHLGYAYQSQGDLTQALEEFRKETAVNPKFYDAYWLAGNIELGLRNLENAKTWFHDGIRIKPQGYQGHYGLGSVLLAQKQWAAAEKELKTALEVKPDQVESHYALARVYQQMGRKEDARIEFDVCAKLNAERQKIKPGIAAQNP